MTPWKVVKQPFYSPLVQVVASPIEAEDQQKDLQNDQQKDQQKEYTEDDYYNYYLYQYYQYYATQVGFIYNYDTYNIRFFLKIMKD